MVPRYRKDPNQVGLTPKRVLLCQAVLRAAVHALCSLFLLSLGDALVSFMNKLGVCGQIRLVSCAKLAVRVGVK